jgi:hypothetical protein
VSTPPDKPAPPVRWETIERVARDAEKERLAEASADAIDDELRKAGMDPAEADRAFGRAVAEVEKRQGPGATRGGPRAPVGASGRAGREGSGRRTWIALLAAAALVLLALFAWRGREIVAWLKGAPEPIEPDHWKEVPPSVPASSVDAAPAPAPPDTSKEPRNGPK